MRDSRYKRWIRWVGVVAFVVMLWPAMGYALTLHEAKGQGLVGEKPNGYLGLVTSSAQAQSLMNNVNAKRKQKYQEIATRNKTSLSAVEALAGKTAIQKTKSGQYVQLPSGQWKKK